MLRKFLRYISLQGHIEDHETIHDAILKGIEFRGINLWILVFAISMICVGLNINSPAVIIGAMLISPMMGPIVGMGYCVATYNFVLFRRALKNFAFASVAELVTSTLYFLLSPVSTASSELLAFTHPTIYDVLVAVFGGLAAIIGISNKTKVNVIAGAAVATALMPPLCTAGYGIATGHPEYFFGAMYLFAINAVFIGIAATLVSRFLKFPISGTVDPVQKKRTGRWIWILIIVTGAPSIYFGYKLVQEERFKEKAGFLISSVSFLEGNYLLDKEIDLRTETIRLIYGGDSMTVEDKRKIFGKARDLGLDSSGIVVEQGLAFKDRSEALTEADRLRIEMKRMSEELEAKRLYEDSLKHDAKTGKELLGEIKTFYPRIKTCAYSSGWRYETASDSAQKVRAVIFSASEPLNSRDKIKITEWVEQRLKTETVKVYFD